MPFPTLSCCTTVCSTPLMIKMATDVKAKHLPQNIHSTVSVWLFGDLARMEFALVGFGPWKRTGHGSTVVLGALCADWELPRFAAHVLLLSSHTAKNSTRDEARPGRHSRSHVPDQALGTLTEQCHWCQPALPWPLSPTPG